MRLPGACAQPGEAPPLEPPRARSAQMSRVGLEKGKAGEGSAARGTGPYVAASLPPASSPGPVSPRRGPAPSSRRPSQWRGCASRSGRGRGLRAGPGAPAPCRPPRAERRRRWRRRRLGESEQRAGAQSVSEGAQPPACPPPPPLRKREPGPGPGTLPQPLPRRQAARAVRASQGEGERAGAGRRRPDRASARACGVRGSRCPPPSPSLLSPVLRARKFSAVFGTLSANSSKETRPKGSPSTAMSKNTVGLTMAGIKKL